jgi:uncharacterized protein (DUF1810 family)
MPRAETTRDQGDPFDLARFTSAQEAVYGRALAEIRSGAKRSHWMWFIFPQMDGLGFSSTAQHYALKSADRDVALFERLEAIADRIMQLARTLHTRLVA